MDIACCHLDGNADAVEFCPHQSLGHILAAATYTLEEGIHPNRYGSISLFNVDADKKGLELLDRKQTVGIFDVKWNPPGCSMHPLLAQADASGYFTLYSLHSNKEENVGAVLTEECKQRVGEAMCLHADWSPSSSLVSLGLSDGSISVVSVGEANIQVSHTWAAHGYEVWATAFDASSQYLLYSGSDDCHFSCWDLREESPALVSRDTKSHQMGVCCFAQDPMNSNMLLTGSYDEFLRVWDLRSASKPVSRFSVCLGGGVWRIKYHPNIPGLLLAACMHNGFFIVRVGDEAAVMVESYGKHESLAYGADWQREECEENGSQSGSLVATCSFYDRLLCVWKPKSLTVKGED